MIKYVLGCISNKNDVNNLQKQFQRVKVHKGLVQKQKKKPCYLLAKYKRTLMLHFHLGPTYRYDMHTIIQAALILPYRHFLFHNL